MKPSYAALLTLLALTGAPAVQAQGKPLIYCADASPELTAPIIATITVSFFILVSVLSLPWSGDYAR